VKPRRIKKRYITHTPKTNNKPKLPSHYQTLKHKLAVVGPDEQAKLLKNHGKGKTPKLIFTVNKNLLNIKVGDVVVQPDGLYKCSEVRRGASCQKMCHIILVPCDPKEVKGKLMVNK